MAALTYREMWEIYVEPNLKAQEEIDQVGKFDDDAPLSLDERIKQAQAMGMMFGVNPLEIGKSMRKEQPLTKEGIESIRQKLRERETK